MASESSRLWEQRWHPLREEWVLYTSHRGGRPWIGETVDKANSPIPSHDPTCALCPGNQRLKGTNPDYTGTYWFTNDLPCFADEAPQPGPSDELYRTRRAGGTAEVICYHPDHGKTLSELTLPEAAGVVDLYRARTRELSQRDDVAHVLIFENKGALVGTSNPHPHCQVYAGAMVYGITAQEWKSAENFHQSTGKLLGQEIYERESSAPRVIFRNQHFIACVPWFARYAYEVLILPSSPASSLLDLEDERTAALGEVMREVSRIYDALWGFPMPYVMAVHQAPCDGRDPSHYPFHLEYHPPLRKPDTMKYLAGPEIGGGSMTNESNPDSKAAELIAAAASLTKRH